MATKSDVAWSIVTTALDLAKERGWRNVTLADIAAASGQKLQRIHAEFPTKDAILAGFTRRIDAEVLKEPLEEDGSVRDRLFELLMRRLDTLGPHRPAIRAILRDTMGDPLAGLSALCAVQRSMSLTLEAAGISASGPFGRLQARALGAIYLRALCTWLRDDGSNDRVMAQLDKSLRRAEQFATSFGGRRRRSSEPSAYEASAATVADTSEQAG